MSKNLRKSTRNATALAGKSDTPSGAGNEAMEDVIGGKTLRQRKGGSGAAAAVTPRRKSERVQNSIPALYNDDSSEDPFSPSPVKTKKATAAKRAIQVKPTKETASPAVKLKKPKQTNDNHAAEDDTVQDKKTPSGAKQKKPTKTEETEQEEKSTEDRRRSTRAPKQIKRLADEIVRNLISSPTTDKADTPATAATTSDSTKANKLTRGRSSRKRQESGNANADEVSLSKTPKKLVQEATTDNKVETPRSSRRNTAKKLDQKDAKTPVKPVVAATSVSNQQASFSSKESVQGKKLEWKFNVYGIPKCPLPCRESQFEEIWKFLFENVSEKNSGCMYVSGVPGTGKTVIVQSVIDTMGKVNDKEKNLNFKYLYINGLTLASPDKIWKRMFKGLELPSKTKGISTKEALKRLDSFFESHQRIPVILVVDELDQILDKQQSILYQLLEWSSHSKNMFSLVAIFNTMSLPEHGLAMRNYSRMGFKRSVFPPYSYEQLHTIVSNMLATFNTTKLSAESITLLSRKVAAISGDARRALEIARRALEIAEASSVTGIQAVSNAFKEIFSSAKIETIKHTSLLEQLILKTICDEVRCSGVEEVLTAKIYDSVIPKAVYEGMQWPKDEILKALMRLAIMHLVIVEDNIPSLHKRVLLKVPVEDVNFALEAKDDQQK